jgi:hypothetical protein
VKLFIAFIACLFITCGSIQTIRGAIVSFQITSDAVGRVKTTAIIINVEKAEDTISMISNPKITPKNAILKSGDTVAISYKMKGGKMVATKITLNTAQ